MIETSCESCVAVEVPKAVGSMGKECRAGGGSEGKLVRQTSGTDQRRNK